MWPVFLSTCESGEMVGGEEEGLVCDAQQGVHGDVGEAGQAGDSGVPLQHLTAYQTHNNIKIRLEIKSN